MSSSISGAANTLYLAPSTWDLCVDANGHIAMAQPPYAPAQNAANACKLSQGEYWYDSTQGVPYFGTIFGATPPPYNTIKSSLETAATSITGVASAVVYISYYTNRNLSAQLQVTLGDGTPVVFAL
jgi:hypothetical protein